MSNTTRHEMAMTVKDMLTLRMRLAYINSEAAKQAIPRVAELMATHLKWDKKEKAKQIKMAEDYCGQFGGPVANKRGAKLKQATVTDLHEVFAELDKSGSGYMDVNGLNTASIKLGFPFGSNAELKEKFAEIDTNGKGRISELEFVEWWNKATPAAKRLQKQLSLTAASEVALDKTLFEGDDEPKKK
jgi:glycerol-3-phosphate dehydrogenase